MQARAGVFFGLALAALGCVSCSGLLVKSAWNPAMPGSWAAPPDFETEGLQVQADNNHEFLHLRLATNSQRLKSQFLGAFHQSLTVWFGRAAGVRVSFHRLPGVGFPRWDAEQKEYMRAATIEVAALGNGEERILVPHSREIGFEAFMRQGTLVFDFKVPLKRGGRNAWVIEAAAGENLDLELRCSGIDLEMAQTELWREYAEDVLGWGWGSGPNPYGPKPELDPRKSLGLGDYDSKGLDKGIYATHGVYRPLSWASVPQPFSSSLTLKLAGAP